MALGRYLEQGFASRGAAGVKAQEREPGFGRLPGVLGVPFGEALGCHLQALDPEPRTEGEKQAVDAGPCVGSSVGPASVSYNPQGVSKLSPPY